MQKINISQNQINQKNKGILPIRQSSVLESLISANLPLVGSGSAYASCGTYFTKGCLNISNHHGISNLLQHDLSGKGKAYLQRQKKHCDRPLCPTCKDDWANREKDRAVQRIKAYFIKRLEPTHIVVSVPEKDHYLTLEKMRKEVYKNLKSVHVVGGMMIYHPKRQRCVKCGSPKPYKRKACQNCVSYEFEWYYSPHFHVLGYGWVQDVRKNYFSSGYVVKNLGIRTNLAGTIFYQLSHCGVHPKKHSITWFGVLSYNKLKVIYKESDPLICPQCFNVLRKVIYLGTDKLALPNVEGVGFYDDPENWEYAPNRMKIHYS